MSTQTQAEALENILELQDSEDYPHVKEEMTKAIARRALSARDSEGAPLVTGSITLRVENGRWVAEYSSARVRELMGTSVLPTAFASSVSGDEVAGFIRERHEGVKVEVMS